MCKTCKQFINEARDLLMFTQMSDSADHLRKDYREAWAFVRKVANVKQADPMPLDVQILEKNADKLAYGN